MKAPVGTFGELVRDDGRRLSEAVRLAVIVGGAGAWLAARLSDGGTDGQLYATKAEAIRFQLHENQCAYLKVPPGGMPPVEATRYLQIHRELYAAGARLADPDMTPDLSLMPREGGLIVGR